MYYISVVDSDLESANYHRMVGLLDRVLARIEPLVLSEQQLRVIIGAIGDELLAVY